MTVRYRELCEVGVGATVEHAALATATEEHILWELLLVMPEMCTVKNNHFVFIHTKWMHCSYEFY